MSFRTRRRREDRVAGLLVASRSRVLYVPGRVLRETEVISSTGEHAAKQSGFAKATEPADRRGGESLLPSSLLRRDERCPARVSLPRGTSSRANDARAPARLGTVELDEGARQERLRENKVVGG